MNQVYTNGTKAKTKSKENGAERSASEIVQLRNPHLDKMDHDFLYHIALDTRSHDLEEMFGDVRFVCMGGTKQRMETFAYYLMNIIGFKLPTGTLLEDLSQHSYRYSLYKVGPVLSVSHGMGSDSIGILLHEIMKLIHYAKVKDPIFFRIGTCGGVGNPGGTVIISQEAIDGLGNHYYEVPILGKNIRRPAVFSKQLVQELIDCIDPKDTYKTVIGTTMCAKDYYEGQGRIDGAFCDYTEAEKNSYLQRLADKGVVNIEMESIPFAALTHHAGIRAAAVCVSFLDRLEADKVNVPGQVLSEWQLRPQKLVATYIKRYLQKQ